MKHANIEALVEYVKPYQKAAFVSQLIETLGMDHPLSLEAFDYMSKYPIVKKWRDNPNAFMVKILQACCEEFAVQVDDVTSGNRSGNHVEAKRMWMFLVEGVMSNNFDSIAQFIQMDKSSIKYHISKTKSFIETNRKYSDKAKAIVDKLQAEGMSEVVDFFIKEINHLQRDLNKRK